MGIMKQSTTSSSSSVDSEECKDIDDVAVIEERNVVNDVAADSDRNTCWRFYSWPGFRGISLSVSRD